MNNLVEKIKATLRIDKVAYGVLTLCSAAVSFFRIDYQSLWNDESISIEWAAKKSLAWIWENVPKYDLHPPLYYTALHFWQTTFGDSVFSIRALSALFFIGTVLLLFYFAKLLFNSRSAAFLTAFIYLTNPFAVLYSQEVRSYSMLLFFLTLNTVFFYRLVYLKEKNKYFYIGYVVSSLVMMYANILSLFALLAHGILVLVMRDWQLFKRFAVLYILLAIAYIPAFQIIRNANQYDYSYYYTENLNIVVKAIIAFAGFVGAKINIYNGKHHTYALLGISLGLYGLIVALTITKVKQLQRFIVTFFLVSFMAVLIVADRKFPAADPKYFWVSFPAFLFLIVNCILLMPRRVRIASVVALFALNGVFLYNYFFVKKYEKENWKSVVMQVEKDFQDESNKTGLVVSPVNAPHTTWSYYAHDIIPAIGAQKYGPTTSSMYRALDEANTPKKDVVYLSRFIYQLYDPSDAIRLYFESHGYIKTRVFSDTKVEFWRFDKNN